MVGLPGESVQIKGGNVLIDGQIARKSQEEIRAMRILVHDSRFIPHDADRYPRFYFLRGWPRHRLPSGWQQTEAGFTHQPVPLVQSGIEPEDWLVYRHWNPVLNRYGPIRDHYAYNGGDLEADNLVPDLSLEARLAISTEVETISVRIRSGSDRFVVRIPVQGQGKLEVARNDQQLHVQPLANPAGHLRTVAAQPSARCFRRRSSAGRLP